MCHGTYLVVLGVREFFLPVLTRAIFGHIDTDIVKVCIFLSCMLQGVSVVG